MAKFQQLCSVTMLDPISVNEIMVCQHSRQTCCNISIFRDFYIFMIENQHNKIFVFIPPSYGGPEFHPCSKSGLNWWNGRSGQTKFWLGPRKSDTFSFSFGKKNYWFDSIYTFVDVSPLHLLGHSHSAAQEMLGKFLGNHLWKEK